MSDGLSGAFRNLIELMRDVAVLRPAFWLTGPMLALAVGCGVALLAPGRALAMVAVDLDKAAIVDPLDDSWHQVRIEQHFFIRITPGGPAVPPQMQVELQQEEVPSHYEEHRVGRCLAIGGIGAVQGGEGNRLLLFMRDQHIISAMLEKACQARDFYSGFYVERNSDGLICADRDTLQSRSGANCKLKRLFELVPAGWRRFP